MPKLNTNLSHKLEQHVDHIWNTESPKSDHHTTHRFSAEKAGIKHSWMSIRFCLPHHHRKTFSSDKNRSFGAISVYLSMSHLKGVLNEGEDHFLTPSPKWGNLIFFFSASFSPSHLLSPSPPVFHPSRDPSPWKLNEGMYCIGSAVSGPVELIGEKLFVPLLLQSTCEKKVSEQKKVYPAIIAQ